MKCEQYADWLQLSVDGRLDAIRQRSLDAHLAVCAACRHDYALLEEVRDALAMPVVADIDLTDAIRQRVARYELLMADRRERIRAFRRDMLRNSAIILVLLMLVVAFLQPGLWHSATDSVQRTWPQVVMLAMSPGPYSIAWAIWA
ncbi:MAG TPA: zf-HC2 domain-containing protein, partial [Ktedonobacterales bacterium]|nr:zf-HC2 domain-containing protein [Ktedonobacterales bacterium]